MGDEGGRIVKGEARRRCGGGFPSGAGRVRGENFERRHGFDSRQHRSACGCPVAGAFDRRSGRGGEPASSPFRRDWGVGCHPGGGSAPTLLYEGPARDCVKKFPQSINIAAALSLAGIGFEKTKIRILADPGITHNTHEIQYRGEAGRLTMKFENVPVPANPKTTYLACLSILAALKNIRSPYRVGT